MIKVTPLTKLYWLVDVTAPASPATGFLCKNLLRVRSDLRTFGHIEFPKDLTRGDEVLLALEALRGILTLISF